jgi:hypothetical protein
MVTYVLFARTEYDKILKAIDLNKNIQIISFVYIPIWSVIFPENV